MKAECSRDGALVGLFSFGLRRRDSSPAFNKRGYVKNIIELMGPNSSEDDEFFDPEDIYIVKDRVAVQAPILMIMWMLLMTIILPLMIMVCQFSSLTSLSRSMRICLVFPVY